MEILTGYGEVVVARADNEHADLFRAFPNSYGSLGYALRLEIELERVHRFVAAAARPVPRPRRAHRRARRRRAHAAPGRRGVDFVDGVVFSRRRVLPDARARWADEAPSVSDYTGQEVFYRSIQQRRSTYLTAHDYLWRWDTDWFWCSRAFGAQNPTVRRLWPKRHLRSDVYSGRSRFENRHHVMARLDAAARPPGPRAGGAGRRDPARAHRRVPAMVPARGPDRADLAVPDPAAARHGDASRRGLAALPAGAAAQPYVNVGFWSTRRHRARRRGRRRQPRHRGRGAPTWAATSPSTPTPTTTRTTFWPPLRRRRPTPRPRRRYDPDDRLPALYDKAVQTSMTSDDRDQAFDRKLFGPDAPVRFTAYDGSAGGRRRRGRAPAPGQRARAALRRSPRRAASAWPAPTCRVTSSSRAIDEGNPYELLSCWRTRSPLQRPPAP